MLGQFSRGNNIYNAAAPQAQMGGGPPGQFGPPVGNQNAAPQAAAGQLQGLQARMQQQAAGIPGTQNPAAPQGNPATPQTLNANQNAMAALQKAAQTAKSVMQTHQMNDAAKQTMARKRFDMQNAVQNAVKRRMTQAQQLRDSSVRM